MSWNLIIYKTDRIGEGIEPLGDLDRVTNALNGAFIALEWESTTTAELPVDGGFRVNLTMQNGKVQDIHTDGGFNHLREFAGLCTREGWRMADAQQGEDVNLRDPQKWYQELSARATRPSRPASPLQRQRSARRTVNLKRKLAIGIPVVLLLVFVMGQVDFQRVVQSKKPLFARWSVHPADGGSHNYPFLGYTVAYMHRIEGMTPDGRQYRVGPRLDYWVPFVGRDHTVLVVRTNQPPGTLQ